MSVKKINISGNEYDIKDANAQAMISDEFDSGTSYTTGDYCIYENVLYKFTSNKSAGAWDSGKVAATNIDTELSWLNSSIQFTDYTVNISTPLGNRYSSGAVEVNPFPNAERVIVIGGRKSQSNSVCNATMEKYADSYVMYVTAPESGEHKVTFIGFYSPIVRILSE